MNPFSFKMHHVALSVSDVQRSIDFYSKLGFHRDSEWHAADGSLKIVHLALGEAFLELFCYSGSRDAHQPGTDMGNDLDVLGIKHFALSVESLDFAKRELANAGLASGTPIVPGRTGIDYFFIQDPDGNWVEIVKDARRHPQ